jgi:hypothetical protein
MRCAKHKARMGEKTEMRTNFWSENLKESHFLEVLGVVGRLGTLVVATKK